MVGSYKILEGLVEHFNVLHCHQVKARVDFYRASNGTTDEYIIKFDFGDYKNLVYKHCESVNYNDQLLFPISGTEMRDRLSAKIIAEIFKHLEGGHDQIKKLD